MRSRIIWGIVLVAAFVAFYYVTIRPTMTPVARQTTPATGDRIPLAPSRPTFDLPAEIASATIPAPVVPTPVIPNIRVDPPALKMEVPIQNGATIDFSLGGPVVRSGGKDDEELDRALREMAEATKDIRFPATK